MSRVIVICEGETEREFCQTLLSGYFASIGKYIEAPLIKHSHGGIVRWEILKKQIETTLRKERDAIVTLLIDYYGLHEKHDFPGWDEAEKIIDKIKRVSYLEDTMRQDIDDSIRYRFIPYLQLHEFEALLFCDVEIFKNMIPEKELIGLQELQTVIDSNPNPELINTRKVNTPSHRLSRIIKGYNKIVYGNLIAERIGLSTMRSKCLRFNNWLNTLEKV